jgi:hypothetical protein
MGQKGSHADPQQINEYYNRRHSFLEKPEERKARLQRETQAQKRHKKTKSKDLTLNRQGSKNKQSMKSPEVIKFTV